MSAVIHLAPVTVVGQVTTSVRQIRTKDGIIAGFQLAIVGALDRTTAWYTVIAKHQYAESIAKSVRPGDRVIVYGRLTVYGPLSGRAPETRNELEVDAIGHDLNPAPKRLLHGLPPAQDVASPGT